MARALRAWAINRGGKNSVRNLRYGPRTRLVRGIYCVGHVAAFVKSHMNGLLLFDSTIEQTMEAMPLALKQ